MTALENLPSVIAPMTPIPVCTIWNATTSGTSILPLAVPYQMLSRLYLALCSGVAFSSLRTFALATATIVPLALYAVTIVIIANHDVEKIVRQPRMSSCCK